MVKVFRSLVVALFSQSLVVLLASPYPWLAPAVIMLRAIRWVGSLCTKSGPLYDYGDFRTTRRTFLYILVDLFVRSSGPFCTF